MIVICRGNYPVEVMPADATRDDALVRAEQLKTEYCTRTKTAPERAVYSIHVVPLTREGGFSLIELMVVIAIMAMLAVILFSTLAGIASGTQQDNRVQWGVNGMTETRCIDGYVFVVGSRGQPTQVLDSFGKGVPCEKHL